MTADMQTSIRASRRRVARSRGALSGILLVILGLWAALAPFIGPYFNLGYTPSASSAWHWTAARGWLEVLPGAAAFLGGLLLLLSASRAMTMFGGWLAALAGAWLVVGPSVADAINLAVGRPDPTAGANTRALTALLFFYAVGAAILFFASLALGRVSVLSVRDVRAAERRAEAEEAQRQAALEAAAAEERERAAQHERERVAAEQERLAADGRDRGEGDHAERHAADAPAAGQPQYVAHSAGAPQNGVHGNGQPAGGAGGQYPPSGQYGGGASGPGQYPGQPQYPPAPPPREG